METIRYIPLKEAYVKTFIFRVVLEPDENTWHVYCPTLLKLGGATWGRTPEEALKHIQEVAQMIVEELKEDGEPIPEDIKISEELAVSVTT